MNDESAPTPTTAIALSAIDGPEVSLPSLSSQVFAFLTGRTHGEGLLHALYDQVLDEPIPARMRAMLTTH